MQGDDAISGRGGGTGRFTDIRRVATTGSTNADVLTLAAEGEPEGVVVVADVQTAGRGRLGRTWEAPAGSSLLCSVLVRPPAPVAPLVTFALALAAAEAVEEVTGVHAGLKWPNDLVIESSSDDGHLTTRKLAGVLAEAVWPAHSTASASADHVGVEERVVVAAGLGINVAWGDEVPDELADIVLALDQLAEGTVDRDRLLDAVLARFEHHYGRLVAGEAEDVGPADVLEDWRRRSVTVGRRVRVDLGDHRIEGLAATVDDDGHLVVEADDQSRRVLAAGDVVHLR